MKLKQSGAWLVVLLVAFLIPTLYVARFAWTFELFGLPVISQQHGWLGPTPRGAEACLFDVGKVNAWECEDISVFQDHQVGVSIWLFFDGLTEEPVR